MIHTFNNQTPQIEPDVFIAPSADIIGKVQIGKKSSIWFGAVLRGDSDQISIGERSNIQDNAVVHVDPGSPAIIGDDVIVGHLALVHGAKIGNNVLIGMNSTILNDAVIGDYCLIGANALVTAGTVIPPHSLVLGSPAKVVKTLSEKQIEAIEKNAEVYVKHAEAYLKENLGVL